MPKIDGHVWVPIDDEHTHVYNFMYSYDDSVPLDAEPWETLTGRGKDDLIPGTFRLKRNAGNNYMIDRSLQKTKTFTGIQGINTQDMALQEGMGPIVDRSKENLGSSDRAVVTTRRLLLDATHAVESGGQLPGRDPASYRSVRPHDGYVPAGQDWRVALEKDLQSKW